MTWIIETFARSTAEKPVDNFIEKQQKKVLAKITHGLDLLEEHGNLLNMPHAKRLGSGLYELRIRGKEEIRILYCFSKRNIYLLHAFKKQTQKTPQKEIETARDRMKYFVT